MEPKREQAFVGLFVIVACAALIGTVFVISGVFGRTTKTYHARVPFAGGLEPGTTVRYAGGPKVGSVERSRIDPQSPPLFEDRKRAHLDSSHQIISYAVFCL